MSYRRKQEEVEAGAAIAGDAARNRAQTAM
jgi:hypothetical protein